MCALNKTKKRNKAFSYLFRTHLVITISVMVSGRLGAMSRTDWLHVNIWHYWGVLPSQQNVNS